MWAAGALRGMPESTTSTRRRARDRTNPADSPAALPPTTTTSYSVMSAACTRATRHVTAPERTSGVQHLPGRRYGRLVLHGRERERALLAATVDHARAGTADVLVVTGEPGVGKTALLNDLVSLQQGDGGARVLRTAGVESESPLPFAALHRLLRPVVDYDALPPPQARALRVAFGLEDGPTIESFLVGVATVSALTEAASLEAPVLCVVDDAQWLDPASTDALLFAARQLSADPVVMVFAARSEASDMAPFAR